MRWVAPRVRWLPGRAVAPTPVRRGHVARGAAAACGQQLSALTLRLARAAPPSAP